MSFILAFAVATSMALTDPAQEARAQALDAEIRCLVCENEPIAQSTAEVAGDMRALVRERIASGDSDVEIRAFFRERYGDFVLFRPPFDPRTWLLWATPVLLLGLGGALLWTSRRRAGGRDIFTPEEGDR
jgi:cytochrome c-type biogenesis protein CcmH